MRKQNYWISLVLRWTIWIVALFSGLSILDFFFWFLERSDVYESVVFPEAMVSILKRIIYYRNVPMFKKFVYEFSPIYLQYLYVISLFVIL